MYQSIHCYIFFENKIKIRLEEVSIGYGWGLKGVEDLEYKYGLKGVEDSGALIPPSKAPPKIFSSLAKEEYPNEERGRWFGLTVFWFWSNCVLVLL